jgi:hypothetical protein
MPEYESGTASIFFGPNPDVELFKLKPHKRSWILQSIKRFGDYYFRKYNNREVTQLIKQIIERFDLNNDLDMKDHIYLVSPQFISCKSLLTFSSYVCRV